MREIAKVMPEDNYLLEIEFADGLTRLVDVKPLLQSPAFESVRDKELFSRVEVDDRFGGVEWPNRVDICIDWIEGELERENQKSLTA